MSNNLDNDRSITANKMYPIDLAPQKITIVKSMSNTELKMAHLIPGQPKTAGPSQIITHAGSGLMRSGLAQIISPSVASQPQMIVGGSPILQGTQIVSQGTQLIGQNTQIISQSQLITPSGQIISPATQIISQGTQLSAPVSSSNNSVNVQTSVASSVSGSQVLNVSGQLVTGAGNLVVNPSVRTLPPTVRVLPPLPHHNTRPAVQLSSVNVSSAGGGVLVSKSVGVTSHVPRGLAAGASLAVRPVGPAASQPLTNQGGAWAGGGGGGRGARGGGVVYSPRAAPLSASHVAAHAASHSAVLTVPTTSVLNTSGVISGTVRGVSPRAPAPTPTVSTPRPLPLLQRNYQPAKVVGVASVGVRGVVGNSAPAQLYYEVPRNTPAPAPSPQPSQATTTLAAPTHSSLSHAGTGVGSHPSLSHVGTGAGSHFSLSHVGTGTALTHAGATAGSHPSLSHAGTGPGSASVGPTSLSHALASHTHRTLAPYAHTQPHSVSQVSIVNAGTTLVESRQLSAVVSAAAALQRPSILRKRDSDGSPTKPLSAIPTGPYTCGEGTGWEGVPAGGAGAGGGGGGGGSGSTTISASSSPAPDDEPDPPPLDADLSPRKKPRKQLLTSEVRQCDYQPEDPPPASPPVSIKTPKRPLLSSSYVCGWRSTALHFARPADVRRREPRARDILAIASQKHVLSSAEGWKVHHLTAQMDDLMSLESDVGEQLAGLLRALETASGRALSALQPHSHTILELLKGNIQRSKIVCEGVQEAREDILRVFTHRNFVSDILTRQADKRCFRKHRSQS